MHMERGSRGRGLPSQTQAGSTPQSTGRRPQQEQGLPKYTNPISADNVERWGI